MNKILFLLVLGFHICAFAQESESNTHEHYKGVRHLKDNRHPSAAIGPFDINKKLGLENYLTLSGTVGLYYQTLSNRDKPVDQQQFGNAYALLKMASTEWNGFQFALAGLFNGEINDHKDSYKRAINENGPILAEIYGRYTFSETSLTVGRQALEWIMLEDYFEGIFLESNDIEGFSLRAAWVNRMATLDPDDLVTWNEVSADNDTDGVYAFELEFNQIEDFTLSAVYYRSHGAFSIFGTRLEYHSECAKKAENDFLVEFYKTRENERFDNDVEQDGYIFHISDTITIDKISVGLGFISADRKSGAGSLLNNPWDPFDEDTHTDRPNAQTYYISTEYSYSDHLTFAALYGISTTDEGDDEEGTFRELNLIMSYTIRENITLETAYVKCDTTDGTREGFDKVWFNLTYGF